MSKKIMFVLMKVVLNLVSEKNCLLVSKLEAELLLCSVLYSFNSRRAPNTQTVSRYNQST
jgi:hypothetical protein